MFTIDNEGLVDVYNEFISEYGLFSELATFLLERGEDLTQFGFSEEEIEEYK